MIDPRVASGTRDILPLLAIARHRVLSQFKQTFEHYGFVPIDTPVLERREVLYAKGGEEVQRQVFEVAQRGQALEESELALRFDLTVPLARFMARHVDELGLPFRRYHIGLVYRGERAQRGRYREFYQCDFDTIGTRSAFSDAEIGLVIHDGLRAAGVPAFTLRLNHRKILNGMLDSLGLAQHAGHVLRALDKVAKIGREGTLEELQFGEGRGPRVEGQEPEPGGAEERGSRGAGEQGSRDQPDNKRAVCSIRNPQSAIRDPAETPHHSPVPERVLSSEDAQRILDFIESAGSGSPAQVLAQLDRQIESGSAAREGIDNLRTVCELLLAGGVAEEQIVVQVGLARGLDYYTGIVFETIVTGQENYGSVCSGGRYDDLAGLFTERPLPGVGASFGLDRLIQLMADAGWLQNQSNVAPVLVVNFQPSDWQAYMRIGLELRGAGIACEIYPESKPLREQFGYASSRGHRLAVIAGPDELASNTFALRDMTTRHQQRGLPRAELVSRVTQCLSTAPR